MESELRSVCDLCGWSMQADDDIEAELLLQIHLSVVLADSLKTGYIHTYEGRAEWLKQRAS